MEDPSRAEQLIKTALAWRDQGVSTIPCFPHSKTPMITSWLALTWSLPEPGAIRRWFRSGLANLAVISGTGQLQILDFDNPEKYRQWATRAGELATTLTETTGRGVHVFFRVERSESKVFQECEAFGLPGHLCNTFPSIHPNGSYYHFLPHTGAALLQVDKAALFSLLSELPGKQSTRPLADSPTLPPPQNSLLSKIKAAYPILKTFDQLGVKLRPSGHGFYLGKCPFHEDKNPSLWVNASRQIWGCYRPGCPAHQRGDAIDLYALIHHLTNHEAIQAMAKELNN